MPTYYLTTRIITWLVAVVIGLGGLLGPAGYFLLSYQYFAGGLEAEAEINSRIITEIINSNPAMWQYETVRLQEYLQRRPRTQYPESRRLFDVQGSLIVESVDKLDAPTMSRSLELYDSGTPVGRIEISRSVRPLVAKSVWLLVLMTAAGSGVFLVLRVLPIRMIQRSEKALRDSEETYRILIDTSNDAVFVISNDTRRIFLVNRKVEELLGLKATEIINQKLEAVLVPRNTTMEQELAIFDESRVGARNPGELSLRRRDGKEIIAEVSISGSEMRGRRITQCILRDVTQRKEAERKNIELQERLERAQRMEALGLLAGGVAHDLNNTLGPLVGYPELILSRLPDDSPIRKQVMRIGNAAQEAADVIQDLLTLARRGRYEMAPTDMNEVIDTYLDSPGFQKLTENHPGVVVRHHLNRGIAPILGSPAHLGKVIMNLVVNAFDAVGEQGTIVLETAEQTLERLPRGFDNIRHGNYIMVKVQDTGVGISADDIDKIFEPYFSKKKIGRSGSGLGLSVVYGVVKDHKGYYDVISSEGQGSEFYLYFPVTRISESADTETRTEIRGREKVLLVDDSSEQLEMAQEMLSSLGYEVVTAANGHEAVNYLRQSDVHLVVLDMIMEKDFDGLDTYRMILERHPDQKAIIASGFSATDRVAAMQQLGAGEYLKKPYTREALGRAVRTELGRQRVRIS